MKNIKKRLIQSIALISLLFSNLQAMTSIHAAVHGDDYPKEWQTGWGPDSWGMYKRQCTSFVAFRLNKINGFSLPWGYGNADSWGHIARQNGYTVDLHPQVGSVAWFDKGVNFSHRVYGHVAWVAEVNGDQVTLEEYNYNADQGPEKYHRRQIARTAVSGYIHFKDINKDNQTELISQQSPVSSLPQKGSYRFKSPTGVKAEPIFKSGDLDSYPVGGVVFYDRVLEADGYRWLSYIGGSGNRRYVPIEKLAKKVTDKSFKVGDSITFRGPFQVSQNHGWMISSNGLAGGPATQLNWLDPGPLLESNKQGYKAGDQVLYPGDYFTIPGKYKILQVDQKTKGLKIKIGQKETWVNWEQVAK
ncbi:CHAP domain-containing protein [Streptococcus penaeicida]|uniref:CHAP domain-containing protein n=1 Tax=Streptococcus penaeicida TaxID=1765960 RepID=UPI0039F0DDAE